MSKPEIVDKLGGYELIWTEEKVKVEVTRVKQHKDNRVTAWLMFHSTKEQGGGLLHQAELNLASTQSMKGLVNFMEGKDDKPAWDGIIEQLRFYVLERVRQGEPVMTIMTNDANIGPVRYLIHPIMPEGQQAVIFGEPSVGKSHMAILAYICLALPWFDNPLGLVVPEEPMVPLYIDYESDHENISRRAHYLLEGMGLPPLAVHYRRSAVRIADDLEQIQLAMETVGANCLIIDSLAAACGADIMSPEVAGQYFTATRQLKTTILTIAQTQKAEDLKRKTILGSGIFEYYSRSVWEVRKAQSPGEDEIHVALHHRKANESKLYRPMTYRFHFNESKTVVSRESLKDVPEFRAELKPKDQVLLSLKELGKASSEEVSEASGVPLTNTRTNLSRLKTDGKIMRFQDGTWGVLAIDTEV